MIYWSKICLLPTRVSLKSSQWKFPLDLGYERWSWNLASLGYRPTHQRKLRRYHDYLSCHVASMWRTDRWTDRRRNLCLSRNENWMANAVKNILTCSSVLMYDMAYAPPFVLAMKKHCMSAAIAPPWNHASKVWGIRDWESVPQGQP